MAWYDFLNRQRVAGPVMLKANPGASYAANAGESPPGFGPFVLPRVTTLVTTNAKGEVKSMRVTKEQLTRIFNEIENDPTAGMGIFSRRELAADAVMRLVNTAEPTEGKVPGSAAPLFTEPVGNTGGKKSGDTPS